MQRTPSRSPFTLLPAAAVLLIAGIAAAQGCPRPELVDGGPETCTTKSFGTDVAIWGDTAVVGAQFADSLSCQPTGTGRLFVYARNPATRAWTQTAALEHPRSSYLGSLGRRVAIRDKTIVATAIELHNVTNTVYIFEQVSSVWQWSQLILPSGLMTPDSVAISDFHIVVGCAGCQPGSAYVYDKPAAGWLSAPTHTHKAVLAVPSPWRIAMTNDRMVMRSFVPGGSTLHFYDRIVGTWVPAGTFPASHGNVGFDGADVDLHDDVAVLGAPGSDEVYVLTRDPSGWKLASKILGSSGTEFGRGVALTHETATRGRVLISAPYADQAYIYDPNTPALASWSVRTLVPPCTHQNIFGRVAAMHGPIALLGGYEGSSTCRQRCWAFYAGDTKVTGSVVSYGVSCQGTGGKPPAHTVTGPLDIGTSVSWDITDARPNSPVALLVGIGRLNIPLDAIGMPGCALLTQPVVQTGGLTSASGTFQVRAPIKCDPRLVGGKISSQLAVLDAGAPTRLKVVSTNGIELTVGGYQ